MGAKELLSKFSVEEQFIMSLIALGGMLISLIATSVYIVFWTDFAFFFKIMAGINTLFGVMFLYSMIATTYQQLQTYRMVQNANPLGGLGDMLKAGSDILNIANSSFNDNLKGGVDFDKNAKEKRRGRGK